MFEIGALLFILFSGFMIGMGLYAARKTADYIEVKYFGGKK
jgi:hypothetical protein